MNGWMFHFLRALCCNLSFRHLSSTKCWEGAKLVLNARCQSIQFKALAFTPPPLSLPHPGKTISLTGGGGEGERTGKEKASFSYSMGLWWRPWDTMWKNLAFDHPVKCELCDSHTAGRPVELHPSLISLFPHYSCQAVIEKRWLGIEEQNPSLWPLQPEYNIRTN